MQRAFLLFIVHLSHDRSNSSSPTSSSATFQNFPGISDLLSSVPVPAPNKAALVSSNLLAKDILFLLHCSFQDGNPHLMSLRILRHLLHANQAVEIFHSLVLLFFVTICTAEGCIDILIILFSDTFMSTARHVPILIASFSDTFLSTTRHVPVLITSFYDTFTSTALNVPILITSFSDTFTSTARHVTILITSFSDPFTSTARQFPIQLAIQSRCDKPLLPQPVAQGHLHISHYYPHTICTQSLI